MQTCPKCGKDNPDEARLCMACATPMLPTMPSAEERRWSPCSFGDLVGFTTRSDRADPEDIRAVLRPYHARLRREIEYYGGTVESSSEMR